MDLEKVTLRNTLTRAILILISLVGTLHFVVGIAYMSLLWRSGGRWDKAAIEFSIPYAVLLVMFVLSLGFSLDKKKSRFMVGGLLGAAVALSVLLFIFDVVNQRVQYPTGGGQPDYLIWWWYRP